VGGLVPAMKPEIKWMSGDFGRFRLALTPQAR